ncbi:MAG: helix-turn-helix domain-containing protein [Thermodesulfobacteriota bacterium]|jgi:transcriptional regulator with XRE-family HTH domain/KaiC/GvpD/RAD55 family RecA-like ATPase
MKTVAKISSGIGYLDHLLGFFKTGDNVIWEVEAGTYIEIFLQRFIEHTLKNGYKLVYVSFNISPSTLTKRLDFLPNLENLTILDCFTLGKGNNDPLFNQYYEKEREKFRGSLVKVENPKDLSQFRVAMDRVEIEKGESTRYIFDSLTGMQDLWGDENATYKLFTYSCPRLYDLRTVAYWVLEKDAHTQSFKANLRHITQVAIDLGKENGELFFKVTKMEGRFSRSAFLPKRYEVWDQEVIFPSIGGRRPPNLGDKVRALRKKFGMTQKELAEQVGLTPSFISQLEKNLISPSLDSLLKLSEKLNTQPIYFLMDRQDGPMQKMVINPAERQNMQLQGLKSTDVKLQLLVSDTLNRRMEPYLLTLRRGARINGHFFSHRGDEFAYVMEGELEAEIQGEKKIIRQGDSIYIGPTAPAKWVNVGKEEAILLWVLSPPREG